MVLVTGICDAHHKSAGNWPPEPDKTAAARLPKTGTVPEFNHPAVRHVTEYFPTSAFNGLLRRTVTGLQ
jgi:hypothetical protein